MTSSRPPSWSASCASRSSASTTSSIRCAEVLPHLHRTLTQIRKLGPLQSLLGMIPGMGKELRGVKVDEKEFDRLQAIILSMTPQERRHPELIKGSQRLRIARGSGTNVQAVKQLIKQFEQMRKVMRQVSQGRMPDLGALMRQAR